MAEGEQGRELRTVLAGAGRMAGHHLRALRDVGDGVRVVGIADPSRPARDALLADVPEARGADTLGELLADARADVVHVCTPMQTHAEVAEEALRAGCHVYVEKPVTPRRTELEPLLDLAQSQGRLLCAGHQVLFESPYRRLLEHLPALGTPVHVESYFSFRPVRTASGGGRPLTPAEQLVDVLPHPSYLALDLMERVQPGERNEIERLELSQEGTVHGLLRRGDLVTNLVVSLEARPVEHWLRVVGTNGTLHADFVRGTLQSLLGPGSSGIDKALVPFRTSLQLALGTTSALARRVARRGGSYPGLAEIFSAFHRAVRSGDASPTSPEQVRGTVRICEAVGERLRAADERAVDRSQAAPDRPRRETAEQTGRADADAPPADVLVTGGTGLLGRQVVRGLVQLGHGVRVVSRRPPPRGRRLAGVDYATADLAGALPEDLLHGIRSVVHCAAETAGGFAEHRRNSIEATENLARAAARAGAQLFVHVSSVAVLDPGGRRHEIGDDAPLHPDPERLGPYVWGKAESERSAEEIASRLGLTLRVVRPVPLVDRSSFTPPGRLGRRIGNLFVAVGSPGDRLVVAGAEETARAVVRVVLEPERAPKAMNLVPAMPPTRRELVRELRSASPEVRVVWLPRPILHPLSWAATAAQKLLRPGRRAVRVAPAFRSLRYRPGPAAGFMAEPLRRDTPAPVGAESVANVPHAVAPGRRSSHTRSNRA